MRRQGGRRAARAQGGGRTAQEITIPLPVRGLYSPAKSAEVNGLFAGVLDNWQSDGAAIVTRIPYTVVSERVALQRIPFQFGAAEKYVVLTADNALSEGASYPRAFFGGASFAYLSSQVIIADGQGDPLRFDGSTFAVAAFTTDVPTVTVDMFNGVVAHKSRLYWWRSDGDLEFYYGGVGEVTGNLTRFPLGRLGNITGKMVAMASLSVDAGQNTNDVLCIFTSTGEIVAYGGSNPGDAEDWGLITKVSVAAPLSRRGFTQVGTDVWMMTPGGVISVQAAISQGILALASAVSEPISEDILAAVRQGDADWQLHTAADGAIVIINRVYQGAAMQWCYMTNTRSWFTSDFPASDWHNIADRTEFSRIPSRTGQSQLCRLRPGQVGDAPMTARWESSWFDVGRMGGIAYLRPTILAYAPLTVTFTVLSDHDETASDIAEAVQTVTILPDNDADPGGLVALNDIVGVDAVGTMFQLRVEVTALWAKIVSMKAAVQ